MPQIKDALEETLAHKEFVNKGSGLPKPEDIITYELAQSEGRVVVPSEAIPLPEKDENGNIIPPEKPEKQLEKKGEPEKPTLTDEQKAEVEKLDALQKKIDAKEELNEDETALLLKIKNEKAVVEEEKKYNIAGMEFTYSELKEKAIQDLDLQDAVISDKAMQKVVEDYYKSQNRTEATRSITKGQKDNAVEREQIRSERAELIALQKGFVQTIHDLSGEIEKLETISKDPITKEEAQGGDLDAQNRYFKKLDAQERLQSLKSKKESLEVQGQRTENAKMHNEIKELLMEQPQYQTKESIQTVIQKLKNGETVDPEDELKVQELGDLLETASTRGTSLISVFNLRSKQGHLAVKPLLHKKSVTTTLPELNKTSITDAIRRAKEKASLSLPNSDGSGGGGQRGVSKKESDAAKMIRRDKEILGEEDDNFARDVLGFGIKKK